jgi:hypothetical protein
VAEQSKLGRMNRITKVIGVGFLTCFLGAFATLFIVYEVWPVTRTWLGKLDTQTILVGLFAMILCSIMVALWEIAGTLRQILHRLQS